jgi:hypothetical protein
VNKALVRRFYEEIDKGNLNAMDELVAEDYIDHNLFGPVIGYGSQAATCRMIGKFRVDGEINVLAPGNARLGMLRRDFCRVREANGFADRGCEPPAIMCSRTRSQLARLEAHPTDGRRPFKLSPEVEPSVSSFDIHLDFCRTDSSAVSGGSMASRAA